MSLNVQQYSSGIGHHVIDSKRRALHVVGAGIYVRVGRSSIVHLAPLAALPRFSTSAWWDALASSNSPAFDVLLANSKWVVTPSRHG